MIKTSLQFFGGRGATSSKNRSGKLGIGRKSGSKSIEKALKTINPNYHNANAEAEGWQDNCQSCAISFEAMQRGYNVEALPHKPNDKFFYADGKEHQWHEVFNKKSEIMPVGTNWRTAGCVWGIKGHTVPVNTAGQIEKQMKNWGDGARATLVVAWKGRNAKSHILNVVNKGGKVIAVDTQDGTTPSLKRLMGDTRRNWNALTRVDNIGFNSDVKYLTKGKK